MRRIIPLVVAVACLCGCVQPKYQRPQLPVPSVWPPSAVSDTAAEPTSNELRWREYFTDTKLQSVLELALANNRDLRIAALNVEKTQVLYRIQRAQQYPQVDAAASGELYRVPKKMSPTGRAYTSEQYSVGLGVTTWELDLFGRVRSLKSRALEEYFATEQARSAIQISLVAAVANTYLTLAADRENLRLSQATFEAQQATYELIKKRRDAGIGSDVDVQQARSQVEAARVDIARYTGQVALDENTLNLLVGTPVPQNLLPTELPPDQSLKDVPAGMPSEVLLWRPDILAAEHQLRAAYANIGAARAAFFPRIALTGGGGVLSGDLSNLFESEAKSWNFTPQIVMPIFDAGARRANLKGARADRDVAIAQYEKAIQTGFREVSDSLALRTRLMEQQDAQSALVNALGETYRLSDARYKAGMDSYLSVLVAQRSWYTAQQGLVNLRLARQSNLVNLFKSLGGGV